jgi:hypothetical protein
LAEAIDTIWPKHREGSMSSPASPTNSSWEVDDPYGAKPSPDALRDALAARGWRLVNAESLAAALRECDPSDDGNAPLDEVGSLAYFDRKASRVLAALP